MTLKSPLPVPPTVDGISVAGPQDAAEMVLWSQLGYLHGLAHGRPLGRLISLVMWCSTGALGWLFRADYRRRLASPTSRYYLSPDKDCVLGVEATAEGWSMVNHLAAHPGTQTGHSLREQVLPALAKAADADGVAITTTAVNKKMAKAYATDLPGLLPVSRWFPINRAFPRGRRLRREPQPATGGAPSSSTRVP